MSKVRQVLATEEPSIKIRPVDRPTTTEGQVPVSADIAGVSACVGWPVEPHPIEVAKSDADVQFVGHALETVTPVEWAKQAHEIIGGGEPGDY